MYAVGMGFSIMEDDCSNLIKGDFAEVFQKE